MSRWHRENPDYLETGFQPPDPRDAWDMERKRQKEEGADPSCSTCRGTGRVPRPKTADHILTDTEPWERCPDCAGGLYACATCGEPVRHYGQRCERCKRSMEEDRLERESGR